MSRSVGSGTGFLFCLSGPGPDVDLFPPRNIILNFDFAVNVFIAWGRSRLSLASVALGLVVQHKEVGRGFALQKVKAPPATSYVGKCLA